MRCFVAGWIMVDFHWLCHKSLSLASCCTAAVLSLLRLENHFQILSLGDGPPLKIEKDN